MFLSSEILNLGISFLNTQRLKTENFTGRFQNFQKKRVKTKINSSWNNFILKFPMIIQKRSATY